MEHIAKSKITQIQSLAETISLYFGNDNPELKNEMKKLIELIKEEKESKAELTNVLYAIAGKL